MALCKKNMSGEAYRILSDAESKDLALHSAAYNSLIKSLLAEGNLEDAMKVKDIARSRISGFTLSDTASSLLLITQVRRDNLKVMSGCVPSASHYCLSGFSHCCAIRILL
ncbi:leucine-rich PPR motif-containing protein, mitochondrial-like isoform X2 [Polyodon spathula]|uniref:leucine-rich PPR motif-containing protein, mitochondrial-like isoform X2 n=1 Tax=Polyodon spathula TaxID=7913 RepID=UPI001B7EEED3|nr:leucine-rich PPR motif-containing protein, mitochondrial-like isoform X2 [Polyodon spathula]